MRNNRTGLSNGVMKKTKNNNFFIYTCNTYPGCSGGVIVKQNTNCVVGMHKGEYKKSNTKGQNIGFFIRNIIYDINNNEINLNQKDKTINSIDNDKNNLNQKFKNINSIDNK